MRLRINRQTYLALWLAIGLVAAMEGCGSDGDSPVRTDAEKQQALRESAFGDLAGTLDHAGEVEALSLERKRELDARLDEEDRS